MKSYIVTKIYEADYGCEGIPEGASKKCEVQLKDEAGNPIEVTLEDKILLEKNINEGDWIHFNAIGEIVKENTEEEEVEPVEEKKLAVFFPGIGYHTDKPLLYYAKKIAKAKGYDIKEVTYGKLDADNIRNDRKKMEEVFAVAGREVYHQLAEFPFEDYQKILFVSKSIGTAIAAAYAKNRKLATANIYFTPVEASFHFMNDKGLVFHGTKDPWLDHDIFWRKIREINFPFYEVENGNHSLETGNVENDLKYLSDIMSRISEYIDEI